MPLPNKTRYTHVRTGCITCKSRKVKCSEERPECGRCTRAGFTCAGYKPPPTAWIFSGSSEPHKSTDKPLSEFFDTSSPTSSHDVARRTIHGQRVARSPYLVVQSPLQHGNSDPFNCYAVQIGPREAQILQVLQRFVTPPRPSRLIDAVVREIRESYLDSLKDQATAYAIFARDLVFRDLMRDGHDVSRSAMSLDYMIRSQTALRRKLQSLMNGFVSPHTAYTAMWSATYLAAADIITGDLSAQLHIRALRGLVAQYVELVGDNLETTAISSLLYIDSMKAFVTSTRPVLNPDHWSPYLVQALDDAKPVSRKSINSGDLVTGSVHRAVRDDTLKTIIINQRGGLTLYRDLLGADLGDKKARTLLIAVRARELLRNNELFQIHADALEVLCKSGLTPDQLQHESARVYLSLSVFLWSQLASPITITLYTPFDLASPTLHRLKDVLTKSMLNKTLSPHHEKSFAEARLWALFVGISTELNRQDTLGLDLVCGDWFFETFRDEAKALNVHSWQQAVTIFVQFLHNENVEPHVSKWWPRVSPSDNLVDGVVGWTACIRGWQS